MLPLTIRRGNVISNLLQAQADPIARISPPGASIPTGRSAHLCPSASRLITGARPSAYPPCLFAQPATPKEKTMTDQGARPRDRVAVSGIVDVGNRQAHLRTAGYLPDPADVAVPMSLVRRHGLRPGDVVSGVAGVDRADPREDRRQHRPGLLSLADVNGSDPADEVKRPDFYDLVPLHPQERLRLETTRQVLTTRVIDLVTPIGKGQRALIVSPPKAGKTTVLRDIAHAIEANHPESHLMAVLVDERPEEVTDMRRSIRGEVVASTFDRTPQEHIALAELAIERAKRLVELGGDVVVLIDSITRLGRAYNLAAPARGRTLSGGIDATALHGPKRVLGAARNLEDGGSLTIIATALVETGSGGDTLIFEEFKSTGNAELRLMRAMADRRVFPAVDVDASGTRREELLLDPDELVLVRKLRKALGASDPGQALEQLVDRLRGTASNAEFLLRLATAA
jgi:transcription termination factor Rho